MTIRIFVIMGMLILNVNQVRAGAEIATEMAGITQVRGDTVNFHVGNNDWADIHYKINGGKQRNIRMELSGTGNKFELNNLSRGDEISYRFTYWGSEGFAVVTSEQRYTLQSEQAKDTDNDGVVDSLDLCPNSKSDKAVDVDGCEVAIEATGITQVSTNTVNFYVDSNYCADVHYKVNGGKQRNVRMKLSGNGNRLQLNNLSSGDEIGYRFTYWGNEGHAVVTSEQRYTLQSDQAKDTDNDNDGVVDSIDQCPATRKDASVNEVGCELDGDNDGVADSLDLCPNTKSGKPVDISGCEVVTEITGLTQLD